MIFHFGAESLALTWPYSSTGLELSPSIQDKLIESTWLLIRKINLMHETVTNKSRLYSRVPTKSRKVSSAGLGLEYRHWYSNLHPTCYTMSLTKGSVLVTGREPLFRDVLVYSRAEDDLIESEDEAASVDIECVAGQFLRPGSRSCEQELWRDQGRWSSGQSLSEPRRNVDLVGRSRWSLPTPCAALFAR